MRKIKGKGGGGCLHVYEKGESGNPKGRPRKIALQLKHEGYKSQDIVSTLEKMGALKVEEVKQFIKNPDATVVELGVCKMIMDFVQKGKNEFLEYLAPKKQQKIEVVQNNINYDIPEDAVAASDKYQDLMKE